MGGLVHRSKNYFFYGFIMFYTLREDGNGKRPEGWASQCPH